MTEQQSAALSLACDRYNDTLKEDEPKKTPTEYIDWVMSVWASQNPHGDAAATRERALNSYVEQFGA